MAELVLGVHEGLRSASRLPPGARAEERMAAWEFAALVGIGVGAAAAAALPDFNLRVPGHAILRSIFPMALGLALVPRQMAGVVMGISAMITVLLLRVNGFGLGVGAWTSLGLTGPLLDIALAQAQRGKRLYFGFVVAGLTANLAAFAVRGGAKALTAGIPGRPMVEWWAQAVFTYPLCGVLAGLLSAAVWFQLRDRRAAAGPKEQR